MSCRHMAESPLQRFDVDSGRDLEQKRLIPMVRVGESLFQEPAMDRRRYEWTRKRLRLRMGRGFSGSDEWGELRDRRPICQVLRSEVHAGLAAPRDDLNRENGIAAELEEVVVDAHATRSQHRRPDLGERLLRGRAWCDVRRP